MQIDVQKLVDDLIEARVLCNSAIKQINSITEEIIKGVNEEQRKELEEKSKKEPEKMEEKLSELRKKNV
jgi:hypothetical protein